MKTFIILLISIVPCVAFSSDYDDCILKNMTGSNSNVAAYQVSLSCKKMTTPEACKGNKLFNFRSIALNKKIEDNINEIDKLNAELNIIKVSNNAFIDKCNRLGKSIAECEYELRIYNGLSFVEIRIKELSSISNEEVLSSCLDYCSNQNYFSKKFGECKTDW